MAEKKPLSIRQRHLRDTSTWILSLLGLFVIWHLIATYLYQSVLFPSPAQFLLAMFRMVKTGVIFEHVLISLQRIMGGFLLGSLLGIPIGLLMGNFKICQNIFEPYVEFFRFIPSIAMLTVTVVWLGIGEAAKVFLIMWTTIFIIIINTVAGVKSIELNKIRAAASLGASPFQIFFFVSLPATVPFILTGARIAMGNSFTTIIAAEMIGAKNGIGAMLWKARLYMLIDEVFVSLVLLSILGIMSDRIFRIGAKRWAGKFTVEKF